MCIFMMYLIYSNNKLCMYLYIQLLQKKIYKRNYSLKIIKQKRHKKLKCGFHFKIRKTAM